MLRNNAFLLLEQLPYYIKYTFVFDTSTLSFITLICLLRQIFIMYVLTIEPYQNRTFLKIS